MKDMLTRRLLTVSTEDTILDAVRKMRDANVSSVLVINSDELVVGIITERDIVHKFTLLDVQDKLLAKAGVFMTRPVVMARVDHLEEDVRSLFFGKGIRHFPVTKGTHALHDILGIVTVTDLASAWFGKGTTSEQNASGKHEQSILIVCEEVTTREHYRQILKALGFQPVLEGTSDELMERACQQQLPLLVDIDGLELEKIKRYLKMLKGSHNNIFLLLSSQPQLVGPLREQLKAEGHFVVLKPLDISYLLQLLNLAKVTKS